IRSVPIRAACAWHAEAVVPTRNVSVDVISPYPLFVPRQEETSMADASSPKWSIDGEYFENCNCAVACPCIFSAEPPFTSTPTEGAGEVAFAFHIDAGSFGDTRLDGLDAGLIARTPGPMIDGNWQVALYIDERADQQQHDAIQAIFAGAAGGTMGAFAPLIGEVLGI